MKREMAFLVALGLWGAGCPKQVMQPATMVITPVAVELTPAGTTRLTAFSTDPGEPIRWVSTSPTVATVASDGTVTAVSAGTAFVTATGQRSGASTFAGVTVLGSRRYATISYARDIEPLFRTGGAWYPGSAACIGCHFGGNTHSAAEMDLSSYSGLRQGSYSVSQAPGTSILGETRPNAGDFRWSTSRLNWRLSMPRMPPGMPHRLDGTGRDGPLVQLRSAAVNPATDAGPTDEAGVNDAGVSDAGVSDGGTGRVYAVSILQAWVNARAPRSDVFSVQGQPATFRDDVLPLFTTPNLWYSDAQNCSFCHFGSAARTARELDLTSYDGIMAGALSLSEPPGHSILGESAVGRGDFNWEASYLQQRLRNERMPPGWPFDRNRSWANGPTLQHPVTGMPVSALQLIGEWVANGAPNN